MTAVTTAAIVTALVLLNACLVAVEFALAAVPYDRALDRKMLGGRRAENLFAILENPAPHVSALRFLSVALTLMVGWLGAPALQRVIAGALSSFGSGPGLSVASYTAAFVLTAAVMIIGGQVVPRFIGLRGAERLALWAAPPTRALTRIASPLVFALSAAGRFAVRPLGLAAGGDGNEEDASRALHLTVSRLADSARLSPAQRELVRRLVNYSELSARQIMLPLDQVAYLSLERSFQENLEVITSTGHTRYPLCRSNLDSVVGMIHVKDLIGMAPNAKTSLQLLRYSRPMPRVPESQRLDALRETFERERAHMGLVIDEFGNPDGLVTMEDVLEQLVGEIHDEFDHDEVPELAFDGDALSVDGMMLVDDLCRELDVEVDGCDAETVGGYVTEAIGKIGKVGDTFRLGSYDGSIAEMEGRRVARVHLRTH